MQCPWMTVIKPVSPHLTSPVSHWPMYACMSFSLLEWTSPYLNYLRLRITVGQATKTHHRTLNNQYNQVEDRCDEKDDKVRILMSSVRKVDSMVITMPEVEVYGFSLDGNHGSC